MSNQEMTPSNEALLWQMRAVGEVITAVAKGDFTHKVHLHELAEESWDSEHLEVAKTLNEFVMLLNHFAHEATRVALEVGTEGRFGPQMEVEGAEGTWKDLTANINIMAANLTNQMRDLAAVTTAIANGDLSRKVTVGAQGETGELKDTINVMTGQLAVFVGEAGRLAQEIGTEGILGGQMEVKGTSGVWKEMVSNLNLMSSNLTTQIRDLNHAAQSAVKGDILFRANQEMHGEMVQLRDALNTLIERAALGS